MSVFHVCKLNVMPFVMHQKSPSMQFFNVCTNGGTSIREIGFSPARNYLCIKCYLVIMQF